MPRPLHLLRRWPVIAAAVVIVLAGGGAAWAMTRSSGSSNATTQVVAAKYATINQTVSTSGTIEPLHSADLDFATSGRVTSIRVKEGEKVRNGEVLATVGRAALVAQVAAARASVESAAAKVAEDSTGSSTQLAADRAALVSANSQLASAKSALRDASLRATINGTVTSVNLTKGQQVSGTSTASNAATSSSTSSESQVVIQSSRTFLVDATVDDTEVSSVKKGQKVTITPDGATTTVNGVVTSVSTVPSSESSVVSFPIVVRVAGHPSGVYAGASATLLITTKHLAHVLEIPTLAVTYSGSTATVKVRSGNSTTTRTITTGSTYGQETQVVSGLKSGEDVVVTVPSFAQFNRGSGGEGNVPSGGLFGGTGGNSGGGGFPTGGGFPDGSGGFGNG
ncbi:MAG TPA: efflux RND transporter periplasmic adaptor subunit [Mycobacteriales bacterium]|nr:efflux RND transporter periplasmic adaptor subunit [Mycobacteriales bacterium]